MKSYVIDAGVAVKWLIEEEFSDNEDTIHEPKAMPFSYAKVLESKFLDTTS